MSNRVLAAALAAFLLAASAARADLIFFKDGLVIQGKVVREKKTIVDSATGQAVDLQEGFFLVEDGARRILFPPAHLDRAVDDKEFAPEATNVKFPVFIDYSLAKPLPPIREIVDVGDWDDRCDRLFKYNTTERPDRPDRGVTAKQHLSLLTPYYTRIDSVLRYDGKNYIQPFKWNAYYLTRELGPEQVRAILLRHADYKETPNLMPADKAIRRVRVAQFLMQCGWYDKAQEELDRLRKDLPGQEKQAEGLAENLKKLQAMDLAQQLKRAHRAGRWQWVQKRLADYPEDVATPKDAGDVRTLKTQYADVSDNLKQANRFLEELPRGVRDPDQQRMFAEAAAAIRGELHPDNLGRLETFLTQAKQAERQKEAGQKVEAPLNEAQLLSFAVTGWLQGNASAEGRVDVAGRIWRTRLFLLKYQQTADSAERQKLLEAYQKVKSDTVALDEMAQMIALLPPPEPEEKIDTQVREMTARANPRRKGVPYLLQLPPEYTHGRPYPVLLVLHQGAEKPRDMLDRWSELAAEHGYLLAAPAWKQNGDTEYHFTADEHAAVLDVLRDLRRHFNVDSDRVFLAGAGQGGDMAFDVGLSHPDLFAGVVPMGAYPGNFPFRYRRNGQYLPFYVVNGDRSGDNQGNKELFTDWIPSGYPMLHVQYKGRGLEWFGGEVPLAFDWMDRKERAYPVAELGKTGAGGPFGEEFQTMRTTDNRFYWLSTDGIRRQHLNQGPKFDSRVLGALLQGNCGKGNTITVRTNGLDQVSVWLGRNRRGEGMVDFDKPVTVWVNGALRKQQKVEPSVTTLLEDLCERGDRQRLYLARLDFDVR